MPGPDGPGAAEGPGRPNTPRLPDTPDPSDGPSEGPSNGPRIPIALDGVPETLLWTLHFRAQEAAAPGAVLHDPLAVELVRRIDYPFAQRLGRGAGRAQWQGLRALTFDERIRAFERAHPGGTVVALGEGLETQFWRVDDGQVRWVGVDLPDTAGLRRQVLPAHQRRLQVDGSVLDDAWMDEADDSRGVLITAQGLLMYLQRADVHALLTRCARRFPGAEFVFDGVPRWTTAVTARNAQRGTDPSVGGRTPRGTTRPSNPTEGGSDVPATLVPPPMPWPMDEREARGLRRLPGVAAVTRLHPPRGRGPVHGVLLPAADRLPWFRSQLLSIWSARFAAAGPG